jgi:hypothetical protein
MSEAPSPSPSPASPTPSPNPPPTPTPSTPQPRGNGILLLFSVLCLAAGLGTYFWLNHIKSPAYQARQKLSKAEDLARKGEVGEAAKLYRDLAEDSPDHVKPALTGFKKMLGSAFDSAPLDQAAVVLEVAIAWPDAPHLRDGLGDRALAMLRDRGEKDLDGALRLLYLVLFTATDQKHHEKMTKEGDELLEGWVKKFPEHLEASVNYAYALMRRGDNAGVEKLLAPFREKMANGEGCYLLGMAYANQNKNDQALALWEPYCAARVPNYLTKWAEYRKAYNAMKRVVLPQIEDGSAPEFEFDLYRRADPQNKANLVSGYIEKRLVQDKPELGKTLTELRRLQPFQQAVMNLGQLQLATAQSKLDPAARKAGLEKASETAKSLRDMVPDNPTVYLFSGTIAYELGDLKEGQKLFEKPLENTNRATGALLNVADSYRSVGEFALARKLIEEAYSKEETQKKEKNKGALYEVAFQRSRLPLDTEDELAWLKKSDPDSDRTKLFLVETQARQAEEQGRFIESAELLRKAIDMVGKTGQDSAGRDNELGIFWLRLFRVSGDQAALKKGLDLLDKALAKLPNNSVVVHNAALNLYQNACFDLAMESLDPSALQMAEGLQLLEYLYNDRAGREEQAARLRKHVGMIKARDLMKKLMTLQPRQSLAYDIFSQLYVWDRDLKSLEELAAKLREVGVDESEIVRLHLNRYSGRGDDQRKQERKRVIERWEKMADEMRRKKKERSLAAALSNLIHAMLAGEKLGEPIDADRLVKLAEEAYAAHACRTTTEKLKDALLYRAHRQLIERDEEYRKMAERARRSLEPSYLVAVALTRDGSARALALANADVVRAAKLVKERSEAFPDEPTPLAYALLKATHPEAAAKVAEALRTDALQQVKRSIALQLKPLILSDALGQYWVLRLEGKDKEGDTLLRTLGERGVPLPFDVGK